MKQCAEKSSMDKKTLDNLSWQAKFANVGFYVDMIAMIVSFTMGLFATTYYQGVYFQTAVELLVGALFIRFIVWLTNKLETIAARHDNLKLQESSYGFWMQLIAIIIFGIGWVSLAMPMLGRSRLFVFLGCTPSSSIPFCLAHIADIVESLYLDNDAKTHVPSKVAEIQAPPRTGNLGKDSKKNPDILQVLGILER